MSRQRGSYTIHSNWVDDLAPSLPGCAGWVLLKLDAQTNYKRQTLTVGQLLDVLPYKVRSIQQALAYLLQEGHALGASDVYVLRGACTPLAPATCKSVRYEMPKNPRQDEETQESYSAIDCTIRRNQKESEDKEEQRKDSPLPPEGEARDRAAPIQTEGFEIVEVPAQHPAASLDSAQSSPEPKPKKATSTPKVPRSAAPALPELPADLAALPGMPEAWAQWFEYRRQRRLPTPPLTATGMANRLQRFAAEGDDPAEVIRNSIECGHQGLFRAEKPRNLKFPSRPQTTEAADARALTTAQAVYAALQEDEKLAF